MRKVGIVGLGLIGGSLAKALSTKCNIKEIVAFNRREDPLLAAYADGVITQYTTTIDETFQDCDLIFLCTPVDKICDYVDLLLPYLSSDCIVTDVGSTKYTIYEAMKAYPHVSFIGGHPMAGSEQTGYQASKEYLFENAYYILTPLPQTTETQYNLLKQLIHQIGAIPVLLDAKKHDFVVASVSHVPHIIASALVNLVQTLDTPEHYMHLLAAGGFKDLTRIASASPDIWSSISIENKSEILKVMTTLITYLQHIKADFEKDTNIYEFFDEAKQYRDTFINKPKNGYFPLYELKVDVVDKPGIIATVATMLSVNSINIKNIGIINSREYENGVLSIVFDRENDLEKSKTLLKQMNFTLYN